MFLTNKEYNIEDFLKAISFIPPQGMNVAYFVTPGQINMPENSHIQQMKDVPPDESQVYIMNPPIQKIDQATTPAELSHWNLGPLARRQPTPNILPDVTDPGEQELGCPFVKVLSENKTYGTDIQLLEDFGPFPKHTLFHCIPNRLSETGIGQTQSSSVFDDLKKWSASEEGKNDPGRKDPQEVPENWGKPNIKEGAINDFAVSRLPRGVRPGNNIGSTLGNLFFNDVNNSGLSDSIDDLGDPRNKGWSKIENKDRPMVRHEPEGSEAYKKAYHKFRDDLDDDHKTDERNKFARKFRRDTNTQSIFDKIYDGTVGKFTGELEESLGDPDIADEEICEVIRSSGTATARSYVGSKEVDRILMKYFKDDPKYQEYLPTNQFRSKAGSSIRKFFKGDDKFRMDLFDKLEKLVDEGKITEEEFEDYFDRVNNREDITDELRILHESLTKKKGFLHNFLLGSDVSINTDTETCNFIPHANTEMDEDIIELWKGGMGPEEVLDELMQDKWYQKKFGKREDDFLDYIKMRTNLYADNAKRRADYEEDPKNFKSPIYYPAEGKKNW